MCVQPKKGQDRMGGKGKVIQAVGAAEAMTRWQNKPVCHLLAVRRGRVNDFEGVTWIGKSEARLCIGLPCLI